MKDIQKIKQILKNNGYELIRYTNGTSDFGLCWVHKDTKQYMAQNDFGDSLNFLLKYEITEHLTHSTGYSPKNKKWYGWSHRAIYGFKIGDTVKQGDCGFSSSTLGEEIQSAIRWFIDDVYKDLINIQGHIIDNQFSIQLSYRYNPNYYKERTKDTKIEEGFYYNEKVKGKIINQSYVNNIGKGTWTAKTLEDCKQMAIDFANSVS